MHVDMKYFVPLKRLKLKKPTLDSLSIHCIIFYPEFVRACLTLTLFEESQKHAGDTPNKDHYHLHSEHAIAIKAGKQS